MSWIGINDTKRLPSFHPSGLTASGSAPALDDTVLMRGTVLLEAEVQDYRAEPQTLLSYWLWDEGGRELLVRIERNGTLLLKVMQGDTITAVGLPLPVMEMQTRIRVSYSWDVPARIASLTVENLDTHKTCHKVFPDPVPFAVADAARAVLGIGTEWPAVQENTTLLAFSDAFEPVTCGDGMAGNALVATEFGPRPISSLRKGDLVRVGEGGLAPVRAIVAREVPNAGWFAPVTLLRPLFDLKEDLTCAPELSVVFSGSEAEYLFGAGSVLIPARSLRNMGTSRRVSSASVVRYYQILLDIPQTVQVNGAAVRTLDAGELVGRPALRATTPLAGVSEAAIVGHSHAQAVTLSTFETQTLLAALTS
ncbi:hypothetical protein AQS8620_00236 [Aquimixticola soesokkakensis]|uniref:Hedgehog/Intein (Hint) domain-containing protein n=1 Tax=Aquimixticola soesokkakensis TaxID=1519096 RepID=A0A1Y5RD71_9RHOB|nr:Hint domain-containing protein [Aquimixticola soesokkakensis]SLN14681.1 hypothetical protein AQS8620_00236 [Aquimixticola soesokkakensis]